MIVHEQSAQTVKILTVTTSRLGMPPRRKQGAKATKRVPPTVHAEEPVPKRHRGVDKQRSGESANCRSANDDDVLLRAEQDHDSEEVGR